MTSHARLYAKITSQAGEVNLAMVPKRALASRLRRADNEPLACVRPFMISLGYATYRIPLIATYQYNGETKCYSCLIYALDQSNRHARRRKGSSNTIFKQKSDQNLAKPASVTAHLTSRHRQNSSHTNLSTG